MHKKNRKKKDFCEAAEIQTNKQKIWKKNKSQQQKKCCQNATNAKAKIYCIVWGKTPLLDPPSGPPPHAHCTFCAATATPTSLPGHCNQRSMPRVALIAKFFKCFLVGHHAPSSARPWPIHPVFISA